MQRLREATHEIVRQLDLAFRAGDATADVQGYVSEADLGREIDIEPALAVVAEAMNRFDSNRPQSDAWLAPRLHSALRLHRREAARRGIWRYLAAAGCPEYVRWRWTRIRESGVKPAGLERFVGPDYKHAFGRLWWMAEVFRNGSDYGPAARALTIQDIPNNLFRMDIAHHRPTAQAATNVLVPVSGDPLIGREANALAKAINATATTIAIDLIAPDLPLDEAARDIWIADARDLDASVLIRDELPVGPEDPATPEKSVLVMEALLHELLTEAPVRGRRTDAPKIEAPVEETVPASS